MPRCLGHVLCQRPDMAMGGFGLGEERDTSGRCEDTWPTAKGAAEEMRALKSQRRLWPVGEGCGTMVSFTWVGPLDKSKKSGPSDDAK